MQYSANAPKTGKSKGQDCNRYGRTDEKLTGKQIKKARIFIVKTLALKGIKYIPLKVVLMLYLQFEIVGKLTENQCTIIRLLLIPCYLQYYFDCLFIVALKNNFIVYPNNKPEIVQITTPISIVFIFISLPSNKGKTIEIIININNPQPNPVLIQLFLS